MLISTNRIESVCQVYDSTSDTFDKKKKTFGVRHDTDTIHAIIFN